MRIRTVSSKNTTHYAIIKDVTRNGKRTTKVVENLGTLNQIKDRAQGLDPIEWLNQYLKQLKEDEAAGRLPIYLELSPYQPIQWDTQ